MLWYLPREFIMMDHSIEFTCENLFKKNYEWISHVHEWLLKMTTWQLIEKIFFSSFSASPGSLKEAWRCREIRHGSIAFNWILSRSLFSQTDSHWVIRSSVVVTEEEKKLLKYIFLEIFFRLTLPVTPIWGNRVKNFFV